VSHQERGPGLHGLIKVVEENYSISIYRLRVSLKKSLTDVEKKP